MRVVRRTNKKTVTRLILLTGAWLAGGFGTLLFPEVPVHLTVREVPARARDSAPFLARPVAIVCDRDGIFVLDSGDADIKVFARDGSFRRSIGRRGSGPGEFRMPGDLDVLGGRIYVADCGNRRVQVLSGEGSYLEGFGLKRMPWRVLALDEDRIVVVHLPSGLSGPEKMVTCYHRNGVEAWRAADAVVSGDSVFDALRNQVLLSRSPGGGFWLVNCFDDRLIRHIGGQGALTAAASPSEADLPFRDISVPTAKGRRRTVRGFCRSCAEAGGRLFLLLPDYTEDRDLGPGRSIAVLSGGGRVEAIIDLPERLSRIAVDGDTIYAIDPEPRLRILKVMTE
jgi:hypothetical protein